MLSLEQPGQRCFACYCENLCLVSANTRGEIFARHKLTVFPKKCLWSGQFRENFGSM